MTRAMAISAAMGTRFWRHRIWTSSMMRACGSTTSACHPHTLLPIFLSIIFLSDCSSFEKKVLKFSTPSPVWFEIVKIGATLPDLILSATFSTSFWFLIKMGTLPQCCFKAFPIFLIFSTKIFWYNRWSLQRYANKNWTTDRNNQRKILDHRKLRKTKKYLGLLISPLVNFFTNTPSN